MPIFDRGNRQDLDQLVEEYVTTNNINRRQFLQRATAAGLSISAASALLAACGGGTSSSTPTSVDVLGVWSGVELTNFQLINTAFARRGDGPEHAHQGQQPARRHRFAWPVPVPYTDYAGQSDPPGLDPRHEPDPVQLLPGLD